LPAKVMYKRFYFVDWVALNRHKAALLPRIDWMVDAQRPDTPTLISGNDLRAGLEAMSTSYFRARPWFEPGAWGGQWIKRHMPELPQDVPNYAWSFDLISPENGLMFESDGCLLEVSFDTLMFCAADNVLGGQRERFGFEFPIRFDLLDTFDGGNLSLQCHPRLDYIRQQFGEQITQDETYYILDCEPGAVVYLGFQDSIDPQAFRSALTRSHVEAVPVDVEQFVNVEPAHRHDLFLIPNGTIHCSGKNNLVLEISATPYIFTFKMYDWLRADLDGKPRPLNIDRAFANLCFERQGTEAHALVSTPQVLDQGTDWQIIHLPTHAEHFYDVHRLEFATSIEVETLGSCHVLCLVEGEAILLETAGGAAHVFNFAETFIVPAAAKSYRLINRGKAAAKVVKAFLKDERSISALDDQ
ncbi:MAG TPA: class I mannose-6-phosphate isomerase, partial [Phototrophicaceae bacterium]|nr:class I mannose-6-phosphate isomerase [Phototrophicaceae bacterium]